VDYRIVLGREEENSSPDELILDTPDNDRTALGKVKHLIQYALDNGYDYLFKCDIDSYVHVPRLLSSGFEQYDYSGYGGPPLYGGSGYWLSRRAMQIAQRTKIAELIFEDHWTGRALAAEGILPHQDPRYHSLTKEGPSPSNDFISVHWYADWKGSEQNSRHIQGMERLSMMEEYFAVAQGIL
jgi:hypothetical protein